MKKGYIKDTIEFTRLVEQEHIMEIYIHEELVKLLKRTKNPFFAVYRNWDTVNFLLATGMWENELRMLLKKKWTGLMGISHSPILRTERLERYLYQVPYMPHLLSTCRKAVVQKMKLFLRMYLESL